MPSYNYNSSNELTSNSNGSYTYDANGNSLSDPSGRSFTWDFENRLTQAVVPGTGTTTFRYDPFGRRIQKSGPLGTTNYLYDGPNSIEELDSGGTDLARYTQGPSIDQPLAELRSATASYYEQDGLGSVTSLSNSAGALAETYTYDSFGKPTASGGTLTNPFQYTGREFDPETGLYQYRARYYDASMGHFLSEDPIGFDSGQVNLYGYVDNSPVDAFDPSGLASASLGLPDVPESLYLQCAKKAFGHCSGGIPNTTKTIPSRNAITLVLDASILSGADPAIVGATMAIESNSNLSVSTSENSNGSLDVGPMQLNSYVAGQPGGYVAYPNALGTPKAGSSFNGDPFANILTGATYLRHLGKHPERYVGRDPRRKADLKRLVPPMRNFFNCVLKGLGLE